MDDKASDADRPACTCDKPDADPFGSGYRPVNVASAAVSRRCSECGWTTSVWHVDDGSAEEELHRHIVRVHPEVHAERLEAQRAERDVRPRI